MGLAVSISIGRKPNVPSPSVATIRASGRASRAARAKGSAEPIAPLGPLITRASKEDRRTHACAHCPNSPPSETKMALSACEPEALFVSLSATSG